MEKEYEKPEVADYGDLKELTAQNGGNVTDVDRGDPSTNNDGSSPFS